MEKVSLNDKTYVKASVIARELGYTTDYVGQLCRAKKVDAQLVGRSWYVNEDSLKVHKKTRYRSEKKLITRELKKQVEKQSAPLNKERHLHISSAKGDEREQNFYNYRTATINTPKYVADESDLLPKLTQKTVEANTGTIEVELADAEKVEIASESEKTSFVSSEAPKVRFKGKLKVVSADDEEMDGGNAEEVTSADTPEQNVEKSDNTLKNNIISDKKTPEEDEEKSNTPLITIKKPESSRQKRKQLLEDFGKKPLQKNALPESVEVVYLPASKMSIFVLILSLLSAVGVAVSLLAVEGVTLVDSVEIVSNYSLNFSNFLHFLKGLF